MTETQICIIAWIALAILYLVIYDFTHTGYIQKIFRKHKKRK